MSSRHVDEKLFMQISFGAQRSLLYISRVSVCLSMYTRYVCVEQRLATGVDRSRVGADHSLARAPIRMGALRGVGKRPSTPNRTHSVHYSFESGLGACVCVYSPTT